MYRDTEIDQGAVQRRLRAETFRPSEELEAVLRRLERNPDDPQVTPAMRMSAAMYRESKAAAMAERPARLDTKGESR